ncbi:MAG: glycoside hydrolase family 2 TIM barrel-domain containing protein [Massilibacteroides sp.]|nr:glycoside hydrolase family 2 TIM barrel-domain containing protein [Massilibacteroides sp.]
MDVSISKIIYGFLFFLVSYPHVQGQVLFQRDFSPAEGLVNRYEKDFRDEICLNGYWDVQIIHLPSGWKSGSGVPPTLPSAVDTEWEKTKIKIPSPINVNNWGGGQDVGEGTRSPYAPSSVYYPSYPKHWVNARMAWLRKSMTIPTEWESKQVMLHFEAVAGECVVYVNGKEVYTHFDSYLPFEVDITRYVQPGEKAEVLLGLRHSKLFDKRHPLYDKFGAVYPPGSNTDDLIGIWQDVYLFGLPAVRITDVFVKPWVDRNELDLEVHVTNNSKKKQGISLEGDIRKWINNNPSKDPLFAPEISWELDHASALKVNAQKIELKPGETKTIHLSTNVDNKLDTWSPDSPNLYTLLLDIKSGKKTVDRKATRFGWRQFKIVGDEFHLNGSKIQCFGDIQHPFGPYVCSRRFAWAWYTMIKDFGGNAVRPHAQPWPRVYYDLADEMGLMVLDETALFGSSIRLNLEEEITWQRSREHFRQLILRDRNHPSVIGWSAGNEMFAIALLNKPEKSVSDVWDDKMVAMTLMAKEIDSTRDFITLDGDRDMNGRLPVWSKHFGHGLNLQDLQEGLNKPLIVGESGATYYGKPAQLYSFAGDKAYASYHGRSEALAVDLYQNVTKMARPYLAYFSPSEVCWFGIEHLGLGYYDYSRLPNLQDGVFAGKMYEEGKPGYQFERIPPYVSTFNPGIDPEKPLYKPLPMFEALKAAIAGEPSPWDKYTEYKYTEKPAVHADQYGSALFLGDENGLLHSQLEKIGVSFSGKRSRLLIVDAHTYQGGQEKLIEEVKRQGVTILLMLRNQDISPAIGTVLPERMELTKREATALESNKQSAWGQHFDLPALYFGEIKGDKHILKCGLAGDLATKGEIILAASQTDWSLFNDNPENRKCAQIVLYEQLKKSEGAALVSLNVGSTSFIVSALDYTLSTEETFAFWRKLFPVMGVKLNPVSEWMNEESKKEHDLLMDGPVNGSLSQSVSIPEDKQKRGYYNRPYKRYEAESGKCFTTGLFLSPTSVQTELQSEASNSMATQLIEKYSYIQWKNEEAADGLVIRFSIPDGANGGGTKGVIALYVDDKFIANITLDSYWAWQHALMTGQTYPDNLPSANKFARMRFDDLRVKLDKKIPRGATFKLVKVDNNKIPYTIDFVELEAVPSPVTFESITDQNKVSYHLSDGPLDQFIANNGGKTIYLPAGKYDVHERIFIHKPHTKIIGAGMWYTEIYFASPSDKAESYPKRGIQTNQDNTLLDGLYITTANDRRYFVLPDGQNGGVGKGLMGSFGSNSTIRNVWIEHFECGGWITGSNHLTVQQSRFRNQYADGINLATGSKNSVVEYCSFRNNGDDDMASWSSGKNMCENITYRYCTAENNWRASSVGFFGGSGHKALNLLVTDGMEAALRATTDFPGQPFSEEGIHLYENISIYNCGAQEGPLGYKGDIISGKTAGAIHLTSYGHYDLLNVHFSNIDIYDSRSDAIYLDSGKDKMMKNIHFKNIHIKGTGRYGVSFNHAAGEASYCNMVFENVGDDNFGVMPKGFKFTKDEACSAR